MKFQCHLNGFRPFEDIYFLLRDVSVSTSVLNLIVDQDKTFVFNVEFRDTKITFFLLGGAYFRSKCWRLTCSASHDL